MRVARHIARSSEAAGLAVGLMALLSAPFQLAMLRTPGWLLLALVLVSSLAALATAISLAHAPYEPRTIVRRSVATSGIAAAVGVVCFAWLAQRSPGAAFRAWLPGILSILPATFCGMLTSGIAVLTLADRSPSEQGPSEATPLPKSAVWGIRCAMAFLLLLGLGVIDTFPEPAAVAAIQPSNPKPSPPETFSVPKEMAYAEATTWQLFKRRNVQGVAPGVYAVSADDRWLAVLAQDRQALRVLDLHAFDAGKAISLPRPVDRLSFDPAARRVIAVRDASPASLLVIDVLRGAVTGLPMPKKRAVPEGSLLWWKDHELLIGTSAKDLRILNLETLEVDEALVIPSWNETPVTEREKVIRGMALGLRETARWKWEVSRAVQATELPEVEGTSEWPIGLSGCLAISHPERDFSLAFPEIGFQDGDFFSSSRDGAKVFRTRGNTLDIFYFTLSTAPPLRWTLAMPHGIEKCPRAEEAKRALEVSKLCALVYAPLHNPLNGRVVGPDRAQVKAILTFDSWNGGKAECRVSNLFARIDPKDVVADPCLWNGSASELLSLDTPHRWWSALPDPAVGSNGVASLPSRESIEAKVELADKADAPRSTDIRLTPGLGSPSPTLIPPAFALPQKSISEKIGEFVTLHHQAARDGDIDRLIKNYAERVDHFNNGWVDRDFILRDELKYHAENAVLEERVLSEVRVASSGGAGSHVATYVLRVSIRNIATQQVKNFTFDVTLDVTETPDGLKIVRQKAVKQP